MAEPDVAEKTEDGLMNSGSFYFKPGEPPREFHFDDRSQSSPFCTMLIFLVSGSYTYIPRRVRVKTGTRNLSATFKSSSEGVDLSTFAWV